MDVSLSDAQAAVVEDAQSVAAQIIGPAALARHKDGEFPLETLQALADRGLMGVNIDASLGGRDAGVVAYSMAITEVACADPAVAVTMAVNNMVGEVIYAFGSQKQRQELIPALTSGRFSSGSFCLSEPGSGSDAAGMRTRARATDEGWILDGTKAWITSGAHAGVFLVWAKTDEREISLFAVDPELPGIEVGGAEEKMGQHASNTVALSFDGVKLPAEAMVGEPGQGFRIAMMALDGGRIGIASQSLGIADAALQLADLQQLTTGLHRSLFESLRARVEAARSITWRAAWLKEQGDRPFSQEASMAKLSASEAAHAVADALFRYWPTPMSDDDQRRLSMAEKLLRDVRVTRIYEGTSEIQRLVIARNLLRR